MTSDRDSDLIEKARRQAAKVRSSGDGSASSGEPIEGGRLPDDDRSFSDWLPGYRINREIHRGGQGVVFQGVHLGTHRDVAIKIMREGPFAGADDRLRFEREVQVLGGLRHPNIVTIHDSGSAGGFFHYIMDYVDGRRLDEYVAAEQPSIAETVSLFAKICDAVNAAHVRGVIHRDLKPSNILIDGQEEPRLLDFGLAKLTSAAPDSAEAGDLTQTGRFVGSLPWSSPEQAEGRRDAVDLRTDVYALGVMLYQALTGSFPYAVTGPMREVIDHIAKTAPRSPRGLRRQIDDELETILLKCLSKEPERRYQTAGELGRDLRHYLAGEPIDAKRDSAVYMLRKSLRRYWGAVVIAAAFVLIVTASAIVMSIMYGRQVTLRKQAEEQTEIAKRERDNAARSAEDARRKFTLALQTAEFMLEQVSDEAENKVAGSEVRTKLLRECYDRFTALMQDHGDDPKLRNVLAQTHISLSHAAFQLGNLDGAAKHHAAALALIEPLVETEPENREHISVAASAHGARAELAMRTGDVDAVRTSLEKEYLFSLRMVEAEPDNVDVIRRIATNCDRQGRWERQQGNLEEGAKWSNRCYELTARLVELAPDEPRYQHLLALAEGHLGETARLTGDMSAAKLHFRNVAKRCQDLIQTDPNNTNYLLALSYAYGRLSAIAALLDELDDVRAWGEKMHDVCHRLIELEPENRGYQVAYAHSCLRLGVHALSQKDIGHAEAMIGDAFQMYKRVADLEPGNLVYRMSLADCHLRLGEIAVGQGRSDAALEHLAPAIDMLEQRLSMPGSTYENLVSLSRGYELLGQVHEADDQPETAISYYEKAIPTRRQMAETGPPENREILEREAISLEERISHLTGDRTSDESR